MKLKMFLELRFGLREEDLDKAEAYDEWGKGEELMWWKIAAHSFMVERDKALSDMRKLNVPKRIKRTA